MLSFGFKVTVFHWKNNSMGFLLGQTTRWLNVIVIYESRVKWTWHHSNFAIHEVSFYHRLKVVLLQLLPIHDGAVGIRDLDFMLKTHSPIYCIQGIWKNRLYPTHAHTRQTIIYNDDNEATYYANKRIRHVSHSPGIQTSMHLQTYINIFLDTPAGDPLEALFCVFGGLIL